MKTQHPLETSQQAIVLRRREYGEGDLIITLLTAETGKRSVLARGARRSQKRFAGLLEPLSVISSVIRSGKGKLSILEEGSLCRAFLRNQPSVLTAAYAGIWTEIIEGWLEEGEPQLEMYELLIRSLIALDEQSADDETIHLFFMIKFLKLCGLTPNLTHCIECRKPIEENRGARLAFDFSRGGAVCESCSDRDSGFHFALSKGVLKQLAWMETEDFCKIGRIRFTARCLDETRELLERFVPFHLGRQPKSLRFLNQMRKLSNPQPLKCNMKPHLTPHLTPLHKGVEKDA